MNLGFMLLLIIGFLVEYQKISFTIVHWTMFNPLTLCTAGVWGSAFSILFNRVLGVKETASSSTMEEELGEKDCISSMLSAFLISHTIQGITGTVFQDKVILYCHIPLFVTMCYAKKSHYRFL